MTRQMTNEELIEKAVITTDALATAGKLNPVQSDQFIDFVIDVTMLKGNVRVVRFRNETMQIDKIGVGARVTVPKAEAQAPQIRRGVTTSKVELTPKDQMTPFEISDNFPDQSIEGERVEDTVTRLMATQTANDLEELMINGDILGPARIESDLVDGGHATDVIKDAFMAQFEGWLRNADSANVYDAEGADIGSIIFSRMINSLPVKFRRVRQNLRFLCSLDHEQLYREKVGARQTPAGDEANRTVAPLTPYGIPLVGVPLLEAEPRVVEHITFAAAPDTQALRYAPIGTDVTITATTLGNSPTTPQVEGGAADYTVDRTAGTITSVAGGAMNAGGTFKVTYHSQGQMLLTDYMNLILAIGRDITIERDRDIYKGVTQFAITTRLSVNVEEVTAMVKGINIGLN
jgi:hypothetical protein